MGTSYAPNNYVYVGGSDGSVVPPSHVYDVVGALFGDTPTLSEVFELSNRTRFSEWYGTATSLSTALHTACTLSITGVPSHSLYACDAERIQTDGDYAWDVLVETAALFFR